MKVVLQVLRLCTAALYQLPKFGVQIPGSPLSWFSFFIGFKFPREDVIVQLLRHLVLHLQPSFLWQPFLHTLTLRRCVNPFFIMALVCSSKFSQETSSPAMSMISDSLFELSLQLLTQSVPKKPQLIHCVGDFFPFHPRFWGTPLFISIYIYRELCHLVFEGHPPERPARICPLS